MGGCDPLLYHIKFLHPEAINAVLGGVAQLPTMNFKITSIYEVLGEEKTSYVESVSNPGRTPKRILWVLPTYISFESNNIKFLKFEMKSGMASFIG